MRLTKGSLRIIITLLILCGVGSNAQEKKILEKLDEDVFRLIQNDSIVEARILLDEKYESKSSEISNEFLLSYNYNYGVIFLSSGKPNEALDYILKAKEISKLLPGNSHDPKIKVVILRLYRETNSYRELDSLYQKYLSDNKKNKNTRIFYNHLDYVISNMNRGNFKEVIAVTKMVLSDLDNYDFSKESGETVQVVNQIVRNELKLYLAMALIEEGRDYQESYELLNETEEDSLFFVKRERDEYLRLIKQYKARYFYDYKQNLDSVYHYQRLSNKYQEVYIKKLKQRAADADGFIYEIAQNKSDIEKLFIINEKNIELRNNYIQISLLIGVLLLLALIFSIYVFRSNKHKNDINIALKEKNRELMVMDEERSQFFSVISHELRTPIYTIKGLIEIFERTKDEKQKKEYLKTLKFSNEHLSGLVNNALEYTKFRLGNVRLNKDPFLLDKMLQEVCNSFSYQLLKTNTELHLNIAEDVETNVIGDRIRFSQIFINLISNAIKFTSSGNIWLEVSQVKSFAEKVGVRFIIRDDGIGIKKELLSHVFDGFKGTDHINEHKGGSGLGLYIVKRFIEELYESSIHIESEEGKGTTFRFDIEMEKNLEVQNINTAEENDYRDKLKGLKALIVDDNNINLMITRKNLENEGLICETINNGVEAIEMVKKNDYDLIFMDVHMPVQNGLITTEKIREFNKDIIIMALTAVDLENMIAKIYQSGMDDIITKPYKRSDMLSKIISYL